MVNLDYFKGKELLVVGLLITVFGIASNMGSFKANQQASSQIKLQRQEIAQENTQLRIAEQVASERAEIAGDRYTRGCVLVVSGSDARLAASIAQGKPVLDWATGNPLPDETVVCDPYGNTGIIADGVVAQTAFTGNQEVINQRLQQAQYGAERNQPNQ